MADKRNTKSFNEMKKEIDSINSTILQGKNIKLILESKQLSMNWYEYTIEYAYNSERGIITKKLFSGKAEAVKGFIEGLKIGASMIQ